MTIKTSLDLVRYIRHHLAGSEWQDVKAVDDFVKERVEQRLKTRMELVKELVEKLDCGFPDIERYAHNRLEELCNDISA